VKPLNRQLVFYKNTFNRVRTVMENLEKSWNFKMVISRPGKVMEKNLNHKSFEKVLDML